MKTGSDGLKIIKHFEGLKTVAYLCPAKIWTIGYGHTRGVKQGMVIDADEADELLRADLRSAEASVNRLIKVDLDQCQFDALVSFVFNLGGGSLQASTLRKCVNRGDHEEAARQFMRWTYAGGVKLRGLVLRRAMESQLYRGEIEDDDT